MVQETQVVNSTHDWLYRTDVCSVMDLSTASQSVMCISVMMYPTLHALILRALDVQLKPKSKFNVSTHDWLYRTDVCQSINLLWIYSRMCATI